MNEETSYFCSAKRSKNHNHEYYIENNLNFSARNSYAARFEVLPAMLQKSRSLVRFYNVPLGRLFPTFRRILALSS